jgi:hypothetical protein
MAKTPPQGQISLFIQQPTPDPYKKAVQVVHSKPRGHVSFVQRKTINALLRNASKTQADENGWWAIRTVELTKDIGFDSNNRDYLRQTTLDLMSIVFEWDYLSTKARGPWLKASVLFTDIEITNDRFRYRLNSELKEEVLNPEMYALVDMQIMRQFKRASSLAIYEHCIRYEKIGHTGTVKWEKFRDQILGDGRHIATYAEYKYFKAKVLKPAVAEINAIGDIHLTLKEVTIGRRMESLSFDIVKISPPVVDAGIDSDQALQLVSELVTLGLVQSEAKKLLKENQVEKIQAALNLTRARMADKKAKVVAKPAAFFRAALKNGWVDEVEEAVVVRVAKKANDGQPRKTKTEMLKEQYMATQLNDAENYFKELDASDQSVLIQRYNDQQPTSGLRIGKRAGKAALAGFYTWLGLETWGEPSTEDLLNFATSTLMDN